jgi:hypothetical protein
MQERIGREPIKKRNEFRRSRKRFTPELKQHEVEFNAYIDDKAMDHASCSCCECIKAIKNIVDIRYPSATPANKDLHVGEYVKQAIVESRLKPEIRVWEKGQM